GREDGRVWKCTLCYDRFKGGHEPACAKACPTDSIQFGPLDELQARADARLAKLEAEGWNGPRLYGREADDGVGGFGAFFLLPDEPEVYGLPPDPVVPTKNLGQIWRAAAVAAGALAAGWPRRSSGVADERRRIRLVLRPAHPEGAGLEVADPRLLLLRRAGRGVRHAERAGEAVR